MKNIKSRTELLDEIIKERVLCSAYLRELGHVVDQFVASEDVDVKENKENRDVPMLKRLLGEYASGLESTLRKKQSYITELMAILIETETDWRQVHWMRGRLSQLKANINNVRLTWRQIAKGYVFLDKKIEKKLAEEVERYRERATEERRLAEAEAATRTVRTLGLGDAERTVEGARQLEQQLAEEVLRLHLC